MNKKRVSILAIFLAVMIVMGTAFGGRSISKASSANSNSKVEKVNNETRKSLKEKITEKKIKKKTYNVAKYFYKKKYNKIRALISDMIINSSETDTNDEITGNITESITGNTLDDVTGDTQVENISLRDLYTNDVLEEYYLMYFGCNSFVRYDEYVCEKNGEYYCTTLTIYGKVRILHVNLVFDSDLDVVKMTFITSPLAEQSSDFTETNIVLGDYQLEGLLTLPTNNAKPPVVILVHGSGYHNADESIGSNRIFAEIAHSLAKQGIATVRYNERFHQYPGLISGNNTVYTEAIDDACSIVKQISKDSRVDNSRIYVVGHSLGGMVAPKIAELCPEVTGIVSMAGSPRKLVDICYDQSYLMYQLLNISKEEKDAFWAEQLKLFEIIRNANDSDEIVGGYSNKYWKSSNELNVEESLNKLNIPMLILQGKDDLQVYADKDFVEWQRILKGRNNCTFKLYEGLNHDFMKSNGYTILDVNKEHFSPGHVEQRVLDDMAEFINKNK